MKTDIYSLVEEVDTFDSIFNKLIYQNNNLVIPYFNIGLLHHPLNMTNSLKYINFSYVCCENISYFSVWDKKHQKQRVITGKKEEPLFYLGGENIEVNSIFQNIEICCENGFLKTIEISEISNEIWSIKDPSLQDIISDFWDGKFMPDDLKEIIRKSGSVT